MGWIVKECEDEYDFENDKMNLESMSILYFENDEAMVIEVQVEDDDLEKLNTVYDLLYPGLMDDMESLMEKEIENPYGLKHFFPVSQIKGH
ncbi:hypothetical protein THMIRHAT_12080 [Thiosulfativibrio zosterae]|uniref:Uncharacterized protein n=2 Tax=Thiosulfativibrio zosterae TaxID=2675053 RepID=A0A6F8PMX8_9GAMM|nr:hypothetical protein THMIRHAT_12080 [Thiosulfativibrio zosterae]